jgi:hypothetical protein
MHRAFIFLLEFGYSGILEQNPIMLHQLGLGLVGVFLLGTLLVLIYKAYKLYVASVTASEPLDPLSPIPSVSSSVSEHTGWPTPFIQIQKDWNFYFIAFLPYFSAAFAVWILLFEGFIAQLFAIPIIWALAPWIPWNPGYYMLFGGAMLFVSMLALWIVIVFVRRAPVSGQLGTSWWWQGARRYLFVFLTVVVVCAFIGGLLVISWTYLSLDTLLLSTALLRYQIGETLVLLGLIMAFIIIVGERASEA